MILEKLLTIFAPTNCIRCNKEGKAICDECLPGIFDIVPSRCFLCKQITNNYQVCRTCRKTVPLHSVWVGTAYSGYAKQIVHEMKFTPDRTAGYIITRWLDEAMSYIDADVITYVPTAQNRVRQRGFDQSRIMAREFARRRGLPLEQLLLRHGNSRQVGSDKKARTQQIAGAYTAKRSLQGENVLIVDDITTTGATLAEAARTLKKNGARSVSAVVFAQTI